MGATVRSVRQKSRGIMVSEGGGAMRRYLGTPEIGQVDPWILLDWFEDDGQRGASFSPHPHRGFDTVTLMIEGSVGHRDNRGGRGVVGPGGMQWMRAGSGIVHGEQPVDQAPRFGLQFWLNLPAARKADAPFYRAVDSDEVPVEEHGDARVRVLMGRSAAGTAGPIDAGETAPLLFDVELGQGGVYREDIEAGLNAFVLVLSGRVEVDGVAGERGDLLRLSHGETILVSAAGAARFLVVAGRPIGEAVVRGGPFVMNSRAEVLQAYRDYQEGRFGPAISGDVS